jgi:DNA-binding NarL/FixJ family response regulator
VAVTTLLLADRHELLLWGARAALEAATDEAGDRCFTVVATASDGRAVLPLVARLRPDLVMLDLGLPGLDGVACLERLRQRFPRTLVAMLSELAQAPLISAALSRGACGYILKTIHSADLAPVLRQLIAQTVYITPPGNAQALAAPAPSQRERLILNYVANGLANKVIADQLCVTDQTIKFHLTSVYRKLGVSNRTQAVREAYLRGLIAGDTATREPLPPSTSSTTRSS